MKPADAPRRALSFADNPPLSLPMRFFLSAPVFAALAAALLLWYGPDALLTRWSPLTLALTHLLVLGCLSMTMVGALLQLLPVVAGIALPHVGKVAPAVHFGLSAGTLLLAAAFLSEQAVLFQLALAVLLPTLLLFVGACTVDMWRMHAPGSGAVVTGIRLSLAALVTTTVLGGVLAGAFAWPSASVGSGALPLQRLTDLHAMWGLLGWVGLLVIAVAFQVVPMFMLTEPYPARLTGGYATALFLLLIAASLSSGLPAPGLRFHQAMLILLALGYLLFGATTLHLLARRKRPALDTTTLYWRTAMACLLAAQALWLWPWPSPDNAAPLMLGVLMVYGFALSAVNGMLYKIVPFLVWYHLRDAVGGAGRKMPGVNTLIPQIRARWQFGTHLAALPLLLGACRHPDLLARAAAVLMCLACLGLCFNLYSGARLYQRLRAGPATHHPVSAQT